MGYTSTINIITFTALVALIITIIVIVNQDKDSGSRILLFHRRFMNNLRGKKHEKITKHESSNTKTSKNSTFTPTTATLLYNDAIMY